MLSLFIAQASAQTAVGAAGQPNPMMSFLPFVVIFFIFYFLMIRPQKKRMLEEEATLKALAKGDEIITKSGLLGTIVGMTDKVITLEVSEGVKLKVLRQQISGLAAKLFEVEKKA